MTVRTKSKRAVHFAAISALLGLLLAIGACGPGAGTVTSVNITPTTTSVELNDQTEFTAVVSIAGLTSTSTTSTSTAVTWEVNGVAGGSLATTGSIVADANDPEEGIYTAPPKVPTTNNGQVQITAIAQRNPSGTASNGANTSVTSNTALLTVSPGLGLQIVTPPATVPAGGSAQFNAQLNGLADSNATWSISSTAGGNIGSINASSGIYTAPSTPPPGDVVTITASDQGVTATTTIEIVYSDLAMNGSFAFSYTGNDSQGFLAAAGSFIADGQGHISSGIEDVSSFLTGVSTALQIQNTSHYNVGTDGRGIAYLITGQGTHTIAFSLVTNQHAMITRFDSTATGSGTMDLQSGNAISGSISNFSGSYVFSALGMDASKSTPEGIAGEFSASGGAISGVVDLHDGSSSSAAITTNANLGAGSTYAFDSQNSGTGRGTMILNTPAGAQQFAFYMVDSTEMYIVEIDGTSGYLAGSVLSEVAGASGLSSANYVFTAGGVAPLTSNGSTTTGPYAVGGVLVSSGSGTISSGALDTNNQGSVTANATVVSCPYTVNSTTGRIDLKIYAGSGSCPTVPAAGLSEFAVYPFQTDLPSAAPAGFLMLEIDSNALSTGVAYQQQTATSLTTGGFAVGLAGQGITHGARSTSAQNVDGSITTSGGGTLDVNYFYPSANDPVTAATFAAPGSTGRGTATLSASNLKVSYSLVYYIVNNNEALLFDQDADATKVLIGIIQRQF